MNTKHTPEISFEVSKEQSRTITKIVARAKKMNSRVDGLSLTMDLCACHANDTPMDFERLLAADDFNFAHDVFGIIRHMDRETGRLKDFFSPRFALRGAV